MSKGNKPREEPRTPGHAELAAQFEAFVPLYGQYMRIAVGQADISTSELKALNHVSCNAGTIQNDLVAALRLSPNAVSKMTDGLVDKGLVARVPHPNDRRASMLSITDAGISALEAGLFERRESMKDMLAVLNDEERRQLSNLLARLSERLLELRAKG